MPLLDVIQFIDRQTCIRSISKEWFSIHCICRYKHNVIVLDAMALRHDFILADPRVETRFGFPIQFAL